MIMRDSGEWSCLLVINGKYMARHHVTSFKLLSDFIRIAPLILNLELAMFLCTSVPLAPAFFKTK